MLIPLSRLLLPLASALAALLLLASGAAGQEPSGAVEGIARAAAGGAPLPFLLVRLLPDSAQPGTPRGVVTDAEGRFRFADVPAGAYRLQVEQIGYERTQSPGVRVRPGETVRHEIRSTARPIQLEAVTVDGGRCLTGAQLADDPEVAAIWNEVRKGVATRRAFDLQYRYRRVVRQEIQTRLRVGRPVREIRVDTVLNEPDSVLVREARRYAANRATGYVVDNGIRLPDEKEIVDDAFLEDHCLEPSFQEGEGTFVLRFRRVQPRREGAGVRGAIVVDARTYGIRRLELEYVKGTRPFAWTHVDYDDLPVAGGTLRLPSRGSGTIRTRGVSAAVATQSTATLLYHYDDFRADAPTR